MQDVFQLVEAANKRELYGEVSEAIELLKMAAPRAVTPEGRQTLEDRIEELRRGVTFAS